MAKSGGGKFCQQLDGALYGTIFLMQISLWYSTWGDNSLGFHEQTRHVPEYYRAISFRFLFSGKTDSGNSPNIQYQNTALNQYIINSDAANSYAQTISPFNLGTNTITYPNTSLSRSTEGGAFYFRRTRNKILLSKSRWI
jgi:hypothetical protein